MTRIRLAQITMVDDDRYGQIGDSYSYAVREIMRNEKINWLEKYYHGRYELGFVFYNRIGRSNCQAYIDFVHTEDLVHYKLVWI